MHWNRLPRGVVGPLSLKLFRNGEDEIQRSWLVGMVMMGRLDDLRGLLFYKSL